MADHYEVLLDGGGPWGIRLQGGKDFGVPLNVARVTPGSKAAIKGILAGDAIVEINGIVTESLSHMDAQNTIKQSGSRLQLKMKKGKGVSLGEIKQVGSGGFAAKPSQTLYTTDVKHSAGVDHKYNAKPKAFGASTSSQAAQPKKFDPAEYAKRKKEELDKYKSEQNKPAVPDSDVLKMLQNTKINDNQASSGGSFSRLQDSLNNEDLPPPPPELMGGSNSYGFDEPKAQSGTFKRLQQMTDAGTGDQVRTVFDQASHERGQPVYAGQKFTPTPKTGGVSMPSGPNFKVGRASAPTFKPTGSSYIGPKGPPPPAVNAGEVVNPNSKMYQPGPQSPPAASASYQPSSISSFPPQRSPASSTSTPPYSPNKHSQPGVFNPAANRSPKPFTSVSPPVAPPAAPPVAPPQQTSRPQAPPSKAPTRNTSGSHAAQGDDLYCSACEQPLSGPFVSAIGKTWHPDHFCCSSCGVSLQNQAFVEENNQLFCEKCYNSYYAPKCAHCNNAIIGAPLSQRDVICDLCSSVASAGGIFDPISCSKSINWLLQQIREANSEYETATRAKNEASHRLKEAKQKISSMNKKRMLLTQEIEEYENNYETTKNICDYKLKLYAANTNIQQKNQATASQLSEIETKLYQAKNHLSSNTMKYNSILSEYKDRRRRMAEIEKRKGKSGGYGSHLANDLKEMKMRVEELKGKEISRKHKIEAMLKEMDGLDEVIDDAETRTMLAEQYHLSLNTHQDTLLEELGNIKTKRYDALDKIEEIKRLRKEIMKQYNISHPSQLLAKRR